MEQTASGDGRLLFTGGLSSRAGWLSVGDTVVAYSCIDEEFGLVDVKVPSNSNTQSLSLTHTFYKTKSEVALFFSPSGTNILDAFT